MQTVILIWILIMSVWAFVAMGFDKRQAKKHGQRISEKSLWLLALLGGGIGAYFGMQTFRHKTRHTSFRIGFLVLAIAHGIGILYLLGLNLSGVKEV
ncbi:DUF1294 domain-containing protein [Sporosarcina limicola]|uniref:Uncharacterized membrane protein YsdA (DUF1294 family) n=1 Tax=Sporosarcina limicola TaxID=34101 RepID=A0A927MIB7_9BACL|nr:DUF1294 domain-containing protein [Sporosarcina limicola]MBE1554428.1 uncharacterized membrane protein YsdA (DUF1294 family) [Sporosarcina limicola]